MSSYEQYKKHLFDNKSNSPYCQARPQFPEYATTVDEINCDLCNRYVEKIKMEIAIETQKKALNAINTKDQKFIN